MTPGGSRKRCPGCGASVKGGRLEAHMRKVHGGGAATPARRRPAAGRTGPMVALALVAAVVAIAALAYYFTSQPGEDNGGEPGTGDGYKPKHRLGTGPEDFWTVYPAGHASAGATVPFPSWVQDESSARVLLVLAHSEGCAPCVQQQKDIQAIMGDPAFQTAVNYIDLLSTGSDSRAQDCFSLLDPEGMQNYIPLTIIVAKDPSGKYVWHSWEGVTGKANLEGWLKDAMYYRINGVGA